MVMYNDIKVNGMIILLLSCNTETSDKAPVSYFECADPLTKAGTRFAVNPHDGRFNNQSGDILRSVRPSIIIQAGVSWLI